jgi:hypothetical protein
MNTTSKSVWTCAECDADTSVLYLPRVRWVREENTYVETGLCSTCAELYTVEAEEDC